MTKVHFWGLKRGSHKEAKRDWYTQRHWRASGMDYGRVERSLLSTYCFILGEGFGKQ